MKKINITTRLLLLIGVFVFLMVLVIVLMIRSLNVLNQKTIDQTVETMLSGEKGKLKVATHSLANAISEVIKGMAKNDQEETIRTMVENIRYEEDKSGYFLHTVTLHVLPCL